MRREQKWVISLVAEQRSPKPLAGVRFPHHPLIVSMKLINDNGSSRVFHNHRKEPYFTYVKNGLKTIEGRLHKEEYRLIKEGDLIKVFNEDETEFFDVQVEAVRRYASFLEMLQSEVLKKVLPNAHSINEGVGIYRKFYSEDQEKENGVIAIQVIRI